MTEQSKPKRWRPRFSLRTLLVLVTLTCVYFAAWEVTKRQGVRDVEAMYLPHWTVRTYWSETNSPMPFVVASRDGPPIDQSSHVRIFDSDVVTYSEFVEGNPILLRQPSIHRHFIWFFGWTCETPIRWESKESYEAAIKRLKDENEALKADIEEYRAQMNAIEIREYYPPKMHSDSP